MTQYNDYLKKRLRFENAINELYKKIEKLDKKEYLLYEKYIFEIDSLKEQLNDLTNNMEEMFRACDVIF